VKGHHRIMVIHQLQVTTLHLAAGQQREVTRLFSAAFEPAG
jgi:hypothetical protein